MQKLSTGARGSVFGLSLNLLHVLCASREGSGETMQMCRLVRGFTGGKCDKYQMLAPLILPQKNDLD